MDDPGRLDAISEALVRMHQRQEVLDQRLQRIEAALQLSPWQQATPPPVTRENRSPPHDPAQATPVTPASALSKPLETGIGLTLLNRVGAITLVLGVGFFFKWAADNQWIGPAGRVILGLCAGLLALAGAEILVRRSQRVFAQGVTAVGISVLYLALYAAFGFYHLIPQAQAFVALAAVSALAGALSSRYRSLASASLGLLGGFLTPILLNGGQTHAWFLFGYLFLLDFGALALVRRFAWSLLEAAGLSGTALLYVIWLANDHTSGHTAGAVFGLLIFALFAAAGSHWVLLAAQVVFTLALAWLWERSAATYFFYSILISLGGLAVAHRRGWCDAAAAAAGSFWIAYALWAVSSAHPAGAAFTGVTLGFLLFTGWSAWLWIFHNASTADLDLALLAANAGAYFSAAYFVLERRQHAWLGLFALALAILHIALGWLFQRRQRKPGLLAYGIAAACLALAAPLQFSAYRITMFWVAEAAALAWIAGRLNEKRAAWASTVLFALAALRLAAIDTRTYAAKAGHLPLVNPRFLTFAAAAVCLWLAVKWLAGPPRLRLVFYLSGHAAILAAFTQEILDSAARLAGAGNRESVEAFSISTLYACYALFLVALGVGSRTVVNRLTGLILIGLVVLKLYIFDVWQLARLYRTLAFVVLGILLLSMSFLYSHFRAPLETWWKQGRE